VAGRIQHDPPSSRPRLFIGPAGPQPDGLRFGCVQVVDRKIEMNLLRDVAARPSRRLVAGYAQRRDRGAFISHYDDIVVYRHHLGAEKRRPERRETSRVVAIEADLPQASQCHDATLTPTPHGKAWTFRLRRDSASRMPAEPAAEETA
jgi:hypothetical protein